MQFSILWYDFTLSLNTTKTLGELRKMNELLTEDERDYRRDAGAIGLWLG